MPRRKDLRSVMVLGSGPIVIGQACEFDYSGTQALKALRSEGLRSILVNSNPATIMTDPDLADASYIEPLCAQRLERIIARERPDALLPTVGGQTGLNLAVELADGGILERYGVELIGASAECVHRAEDRDLFKRTMRRIGLRTPRSRLLRSMDEAEEAMEAVGLPAILRASFTLGGAGSGIALNPGDFRSILEDGLALSPARSVLAEESVLGWKEYELEVIRDRVGNGIVVCSIENFDAMGVHTGDSITVAPAQTLSDREYQHLRDDALSILDAVGVVTGGSNVQFAVHPDSGERVVIEMNPRVSRSSALASKATGYPIAKIAAKLALGYTLDELPNEITGSGSACFEPSIDYCVVKIPRWSFEKFPGTPSLLGTSMQSVGEVMAMGRSFREALQKALRSLELGFEGWCSRSSGRSSAELREALALPRPDRLRDLHEALRRGFTPEEIHRITGIDPWFLDNLARLAEVEGRLRSFSLGELPADLLREAKREGFSDRGISDLLKAGNAGSKPGPAAVRRRRLDEGLTAVFRRVDGCAAEFPSETPYLYSTWEDGPCESRPTDRRKVVVLGGGPNRIGQGVEFDACCCHAVEALREDGFETIMVNCNPETVSTDYDLSDRLYFEPLRFEEVMRILDREKPVGVIPTLGGQTPLNLASELEAAGATILGTSVAAIEEAEDRDRFAAFLDRLGIPAPAFGCAGTVEQALAIGRRLGYPLILRPSFVLGGRAMRVVYDPESLKSYFELAARVSPGHPLLVDQFLEGATEFDMDAVSDGGEVLIGGILQHIEEAGIHSGDSYAVFPPHEAGETEISLMREYTRRIALELGVKGLLNIQFAGLDGRIFVLEVNPRASRTVPFLEKATGLHLSKIATRCMMGRPLAEQGVRESRVSGRVFVKAPVFPFRRFPRSDRLLGPEMKSTGEVMGVGRSFGEAFAKAQLATGQGLPDRGCAFLSVNDRDKPGLLPIARRLDRLGFSLLATKGCAGYLRRRGLPVEAVAKVGEGSPHIADRIRAGDVQMVVNTPLGRASRYDERPIRREATAMDIPCITTLAGARAAVDGIRALREGFGEVRPLQEAGSGKRNRRAREIGK